MNLRMIVLIKQVPDIERVRFDVEKGRIDRSSAPAEINPFDLHALEAAIQIKEANGGVVIAMSMGPPQAEEALKDAISRGADDAILLEDSRFAGADTLATSYTLSCAVKKLGGFDLIFCGEKTVDGDTGQVGPEVSELLSIPIIPYVTKIVDVSRERIVAISRMENAFHTIEARIPALLTVTNDLNKPRLPKLADKIRARKAHIKVWHVEDLNECDQNMFGMKGSPTSVRKIIIPSYKGRVGKVTDDLNEGLKEIIQILEEKGLLR